MIVSTTDVSGLATLVVTPESELQSPSVITNGDYSQTYTDTLTGSTSFVFTFSTPQEIGYIALSGNFSTKDKIEIKSLDTTQPDYLFDSTGAQLFDSAGEELSALYSNSIDDSELGVNESRVMVYKTDISDSREISIKVYGSGQLVVSQISMGEYYEIPRDVQAGYKKPWSVPNKKGRTITSLDSSPIAMSYESRPIKTNIDIPNNFVVDFDKWYAFIDFATSNTFYALEDSDKFHSYAGFNAVPNESKRHALTPELVSSSISFNAYAKSSGIFL